MLADDWSVCKLMRRSFAQVPSRASIPNSKQAESLLFEPEKLHSKAREDDPEAGFADRAFTVSKGSERATCIFGLVLCSALLCTAFSYFRSPPSQFHVTGLKSAFDVPSSDSGVKDVCPQHLPIAPSVHSGLLKDLEAEYTTDAFKLKAYHSLGNAVKVPTVMYDDLKPPGRDSRWDIFADFHVYLEERFPKLHAKLRKTTVNTYALVYHWQGSDETLKPILLTAHQDVVPVEPLTLDTWVHPPFSGFYDGEWIWGRGSGDDKSGLIGVLTAIESLLEHGFQPTRTVVLAFGIDEERGGISGATAIRDYLLPTYGKNSFSILVDEGGGQELREHVVFANPAVAEKGSFNLQIEVTTPGGHSSVPPPHTGIGILASLITELEAHPHEIRLLRNATYYQALHCEAAYDHDFPARLRRLIERSLRSDKALLELETELLRTNPVFKAIAGTTQAVDIIRGGVKINALPEKVYAIVNHRIAGHSSVGELKSHITDVLSPVASRYNLSIDAFGEVTADARTAYGQLVLSDAYGTALEPAPITPTAGSGAYELLSGTIRNTLTTSLRGIYVSKNAVVAPFISLGNTDTKHYWDLTKHIFRYGHKGGYDSYNGAHTVNEAIRAEGFLEIIRFFTHLILNADETDLLE